MTVETADILIRNALLIDGSGEAAFRGDLAVKDDRICAIGALKDWYGNQEIDASGKALAPGFIDVHTHDDRALLVDPLMACKVSQGVTTVITGNCGVSLAPIKLKGYPPPPLDILSPNCDDYFERFSDYLGALNNEPPAVNAACQVGHSSLRAEAMDSLDRQATASEIKAMRRRLEQALDDGAIGMSTGLFYEPAREATTAEVIELAKSLPKYGGIYTTHMRDESDHVVEALKESFHIGRAADVPVIISHHKCAGQNNHGRSIETLALIDKAREQQPLGLDAYPYIAGSTMLDASRAKRAERILVAWSTPHPECAGKDLFELAKSWGLSIEAAVDRLQPAGAVYFMMDEGDVQRILKYPHTMIGSDGLPHDTQPHPRLWGTFPRVLGRYARELGLFSMEEAVRKMTSLSAKQFNLQDRGLLAVGHFADLVLFDQNTVVDAATFEQPMLPSLGIEQVFVNGRCVYRDRTCTGARPGKILQ